VLAQRSTSSLVVLHPTVTSPNDRAAATTASDTTRLPRAPLTIEIPSVLGSVIARHATPVQVDADSTVRVHGDSSSRLLHQRARLGQLSGARLGRRLDLPPAGLLWSRYDNVGLSRYGSSTVRATPRCASR
jgi:hypothetical protein